MAQKCGAPIRSCVVCGKRRPKSDLVRLALEAQEKSIVLDYRKCMAGRGAYACSECLPRLCFSKRVQRAFRNKARMVAELICGGKP
ncbi:MAG: YlxR family protein [Syntrophobacteraceae bacterium]